MRLLFSPGSSYKRQVACRVGSNLRTVRSRDVDYVFVVSADQHTSPAVGLSAAAWNWLHDRTVRRFTQHFTRSFLCGHQSARPRYAVQSICQCVCLSVSTRLSWKVKDYRKSNLSFLIWRTVSRGSCNWRFRLWSRGQSQGHGREFRPITSE